MLVLGVLVAAIAGLHFSRNAILSQVMKAYRGRLKASFDVDVVAATLDAKYRLILRATAHVGVAQVAVHQVHVEGLLRAIFRGADALSVRRAEGVVSD